MMTRNTKLILNSISSLLYQAITVICGFILPRFFLSVYGSDVNGLVSSITQFLSFISLAECGVGAVIQSSLYKPLADNNMQEVSKIIISADKFFKKISYILLAYSMLLMLFYPLLIQEPFDRFFISSLIFVISINSFAQYYFGITYRILLSADQLGFIQNGIYSVSLILNTISCIILMELSASIQIVKLTTSTIFVFQSLLIMIITKKRYRIDYKISYAEEPIKQKWNGLAQHIATVVLGSTDIIVLTIFSTLDNVSIYAVYSLVVNGIKQIVVSLTNGVQAMFGNMLAKNEMHELTRYFSHIEWFIHTIVTIFFSITAVLIVPFVQIYTDGISDVNYIVPSFAFLLTISQASYCLRLPYNIMVLAAGHYKETQSSAIVEMMINIIFSVILVFKFGLVGVAVGTLVAMLYRTIYFAWYLSHNIIYRNFSFFLKHILTDVICAALVVGIVNLFSSFFTLQSYTYISWAILGVKVGLVALSLSVTVNMVLYKTDMFEIFKKLKHRISK